MTNFFLTWQKKVEGTLNVLILKREVSCQLDQGAYLIDTIHNGTISNVLQEHWRGLWFTWCREGSLQKHHKFEVQFEVVEKQS